MTLQKNPGAVSRFAKLMKFSAWLQALPHKLTPPPFRLMQIGSAFWQSRALDVAVRLDIATVLADQALDATTIATRVSANADATARLLRMLAAMGVFEETAADVYSNNKLSSYLRADNPKNVRAMVLMHNSQAMGQPWFEQLERGVREGVAPFRLSHGEDLFDYLNHHPDFDQLFSQAMDSVEALTGDSFATDFDWGRFERIIDVGGSRGAKALAILQRHPQLSALVVDRAQVVAEAQTYWDKHPTPGVERMRFEAGDVLQSVPRATSDKDVYLLSAVLHGLDDALCIQALTQLARASGSSGARIAIMEVVMPEQKTDLARASFDMQMFMGTRGRERTLVQWNALFVRSGVVLQEVVGLQSFGSILVVLPKGYASGM
ncbi:methyltransferase [Rhodoferax aquaticus]|uniref:Methyltransferase n=1 Tax=Rhodoferax aquaticus TaxID=2527691 RepID=A0A515EN91_9BURK|nr:methyltransferase [Rhodoferax aquaticus]QDL54112.1 methyltransferase [Rhodoferax aquaticus]